MSAWAGNSCRKYLHIRNHRSVASSSDRLQEPLMPGRNPPRRGETGNGFRSPPSRVLERRRRTNPSSTMAASVVRSRAACARAWTSNSPRMSTVAFTTNHRTTHLHRRPCRVLRTAGQRATGRLSPRRAPMTAGESNAERLTGGGLAGCTLSAWSPAGCWLIELDDESRGREPSSRGLPRRCFGRCGTAQRRTASPRARREGPGTSRLIGSCSWEPPLLGATRERDIHPRGFPQIPLVRGLDGDERDRS